MKYIKIILPVLFTLAIALGIYQWQFNDASPLVIPRQDSGSSSLEDYYNATKGMAPQDQVSTISFFAVGDIMLSRSVAGQMKRYGLDPQWPFNNIAETLATSDFNFGNLESPYSGRDDFSLLRESGNDDAGNADRVVLHIANDIDPALQWHLQVA